MELFLLWLICLTIGGMLVQHVFHDIYKPAAVLFEPTPVAKRGFKVSAC